MERVIYSHPSFIKSIPLADRPRYISDLVGGPGTYCATDHTSFESSFTLTMAVSVEFEVYAHVLNVAYAEYICKSFYTLNQCVFKFFRVTVAAKRMSGDMQTSLGNGITNLITILFLYHEKYGIILLAIVVEGDDSLFRNHPNKILMSEDFAALGLITKIEHHTRLSTASFCGNIFDEFDLKNLVDPGRILRRGGYVDNKYANAKQSKKSGLLRAYGFSIYYQYHGCPIVEAYARYLLRATRGSFAIMSSINKFKFADGEFIPTSELKMWEKFPPHEVGAGSREIVSSQFHLHYDDQIQIENYLDSLNTLQVLHIPIIVANSDPDCKQFFEECSAYAGDDVARMQPPPNINFRALIDNLSHRMVHLNKRHRACLEDKDGPFPPGTRGHYCSHGLDCPWWSDLLHDLRDYMQIKPNPSPYQESHEPVRIDLDQFSLLAPL